MINVLGVLKVRKNRITLRKVTQPSQCVLVDQMESRIVEFCGILRECLTKRRYSCAMLFIDHYNRLIYVYLQHYLTIEDTIIAKKLSTHISGIMTALSCRQRKIRRLDISSRNF